MLLGRDGKVPSAESVRVPFNLHWFPWQLAGSRAHVWALKQRPSHLRISQSGKNVVPRVGLCHCSSCLTTMMCMLMDKTFPFAAAFWVETAPVRHSVGFLCCFGLPVYHGRCRCAGEIVQQRSQSILKPRRWNWSIEVASSWSFWTHSSFWYCWTRWSIDNRWRCCTSFERWCLWIVH